MPGEKQEICMKRLGKNRFITNHISWKIKPYKENFTSSNKICDKFNGNRNK